MTFIAGTQTASITLRIFTGAVNYEWVNSGFLFSAKALMPEGEILVVKRYQVAVDLPSF
jgi:hypothetical protein